jgi:hypothetical protein
MSLSRAELWLLQVVQESAGRWDFRKVDREFWGKVEVSPGFDLLETLKRLGAEGLVFDVDPKIWGAGFGLTASGRNELIEAGLSAMYVVISYRPDAVERSLQVESSWLDGDDASNRAQSLNGRPYDDRVYVAVVAKGMRSAVNAERADE